MSVVTSFFSVTLFISMFVSGIPSIVLAQDNLNITDLLNIASSTPLSTTLHSTNFCTVSSNITPQVDKAIKDSQKAYNSKKIDQLISLNQSKVNLEIKIEQSRQKGDLARANALISLQKKIKTPLQKQALSDFRITVNSALEARRVAVDGALQNFLTGLTTLLAEKKASYAEALRILQQKINNDSSQLIKECDNGTPSSVVKLNFAYSIKADQTQFKETVSSFATITQSVNALIAVRNNSIKNSNDLFNHILQQSASQLKASFRQ